MKTVMDETNQPKRSEILKIEKSKKEKERKRSQTEKQQKGMKEKKK